MGNRGGEKSVTKAGGTLQPREKGKGRVQKGRVKKGKSMPTGENLHRGSLKHRRGKKRGKSKNKNSGGFYRERD